MGEATDRKVTEIEETRLQLSQVGLELPACLKSLAGIVLGSTALTALLLRRLRSRRSDEHPSTEVVVRIVRDDV